MKRICIIETESHYEVVRNFVLSIIDKADFTIITNTFCAGNLGVLESDNVVIYNYEKENEKVGNIIKEEYDCKLTTTPPSFEFYRQNMSWFIGSDLVVHNLNYWFEPFRNIYFFKKLFPVNVKSLLRFLKYLPDLMRRRKHYKKTFRRFLAPSKELYENYRSHDKLSAYIRLDHNRFEPGDSEDGLTKIVIPGTVNDFRDYDMALQVLSDVAVQEEKKYKVVLLGRNPGKRSFARYENPYLGIQTFEESLSDEEYTRLLRTADFGILPLREEIEHLGILEKKGSSNISGGVNDLVYVGLRGLVPEFYTINKDRNIAEYLDPKDLKKKFQALLDLKNKEIILGNFNTMVSKVNLNLFQDA